LKTKQHYLNRVSGILSATSMHDDRHYNRFVVAPRDSISTRHEQHPVTITVDPISLIISECIAVTSALQKHSRLSTASVAAILGGERSSSSIVLRSSSGATIDVGWGPAETTAAHLPQDGLRASRWVRQDQKGKDKYDDLLWIAFGNLRQAISTVKDIQLFDSLHLIQPFLNVIQSRGIAASVTTLAIGSLRKIIAYGFITYSSPRADVAIQSLAMAITRCHFDGTDSGQAEIVLSMILHLMEDIISGLGGHLLSDESVCEMIGRGLAICSQPRFSALLRHTAQSSMARMCELIFQNVRDMNEDTGRVDSSASEKIEASLHHIPRPHSISLLDGEKKSDEIADHFTHEPDRSQSSFNASSSPQLPSQTRDYGTQIILVGRANLNETTENDSSVPTVQYAKLDHASVECSGSESMTGERKEGEALHALPSSVHPYTLLSVRELFRVMINFLDPHNEQNTDAMRRMSLHIIKVSLEVSGPYLAKHPSITSLIENRLCFYLLQLLRSENTTIFQDSLAVATLLFTTCRRVLKIQQELYLSYLATCLYPLAEIPTDPAIDKSLYKGIPQSMTLSEGQSKHQYPRPNRPNSIPDGSRRPDARQAMIESIGMLMRVPSFMIDLFVNYDCEEDRLDLCQDIIGLLARNALPDSATWSSTSVPPLCLNAMLQYVDSIVLRLDYTADTPVSTSAPVPEDLRRRREKKSHVVEGASRFNESPREGLQYLCNHGIISSSADPQSVSLFLRLSHRISKKVLGEFLSKKGNETVLEYFMKAFNFKSKRVDEALRVVLKTFRLPGEAPLISRIVAAFSEAYSATEGVASGTTDKDAVFILTYAIILLNTDQHNPNVKHQRRMKLEDFSRNLRGQNGGHDFDSDYLSEIYNSIKADEIIMPDEHDNETALDSAWRELLDNNTSIETVIDHESPIYDSDMFAATWRPIVSTLAYVFMSATDDAVFTRIVAGFDGCARIAAQYNNTEAMDEIVYCLSYMTTLATPTLLDTKLNTEIQTEGNGKVMVSELSVKLGRDVRAQLATLVLFRVVTGNEPMLQHGWTYIARICLNLFVNSLIPPPCSATLFVRPPLPPIPLRTTTQVLERTSKTADSGFFSAFTSYISSYAADEPPEPSDEELESTLCTMDCISSCHLEDVFNNIAKMQPESLKGVITSFLGEIGEDGQTDVMTVKSVTSTADGDHVSSSASDGIAVDAPIYDPSLVYILELCTVLSCTGGVTTGEVAKPVVATLTQLLRSPGRVHPLVVARASFYAFELLKHSHESGFINVPILLHSISCFHHELLSQAHTLILCGMMACARSSQVLKRELMASPDFWAILLAFSHIPDATALTFDVVEICIDDMPPTILASNYETIIELLGLFATAACSRSDAGTQRGKSPADTSVSITRGVKAVTTAYEISLRAPNLINQSHLETAEAWSTYWLPIFRLLSAQIINPCRDIRSRALTYLQRLLLSPDISVVEADEWATIFERVLFPLIDSLLKPEVYVFHRDFIGDMRVQCTSLLCKAFLRYLVHQSSWDQMTQFWFQVIDTMGRLTNSGQGNSAVGASDHLHASTRPS
jgi:brefeldin A-resistance guanine nucleotide exchange factor 1